MGILSNITHYFMGKYGNVQTGDEIVDGRVITANNEPGDQATKNEALPPMEEDWDVPVDYIESMVKRGVKERTAKEYAIDVKSFGVNPETLTVDQIKNRISPLREASKRRKITALRSYARWLLSVDKTALWLEISTIGMGELLS